MKKMHGISRIIKSMLVTTCIGFSGASLTLCSTPLSAIASEADSHSIETENAKLSYVGSRMLDESIPYGDDAGKDYVLVIYEYENYTTDAKMPQSDFNPTVYQNGVELSKLSSRRENESDDYTLLDNFYKTVIKGGKLQYGQAYELTDTSPLTIILKENGSHTVDPVSFETNIGDEVSTGDDQTQSQEEGIAEDDQFQGGDITSETEAKPEVSEQPEMTAEELEAEISRQPVRVLDAEVSGTDDLRFDVSWDSGLILPHIINESEDEIQHINIYFAAWDANNLPVTLQSRHLDYKAGYTPNIILAEVNLVPGALYNKDDADTFQFLPVDRTCNVVKAKAIVAVYTTFDGDKWQNPYINDWLEIYGGKKLTEAEAYTDAETVTKVQEALNAAGFDCGTPDGKAGPKTYEALNAYQSQNGLVVTNDITDSLLVSLGVAEETESESDQ